MSTTAAVIDLRRRYELVYEHQLGAPSEQRWTCLDLATFDGAPDSTGVSTCIGRGPTPNHALRDLLEQIAEWSVKEAL